MFFSSGSYALICVFFFLNLLSVVPYQGWSVARLLVWRDKLILLFGINHLKHNGLPLLKMFRVLEISQVILFVWNKALLFQVNQTFNC